MADFGYRLMFAKRIAGVMATFSEEEQDEVFRICGLIQLEPVPDPATKVVLSVPPAIFTVYHASQFWVVYHVVGHDINVVNVGRATGPATYR